MRTAAAVKRQRKLRETKEKQRHGEMNGRILFFSPLSNRRPQLWTEDDGARHWLTSSFQLRKSASVSPRRRQIENPDLFPLDHFIASFSLFFLDAPASLPVFII